MPIIEHVQPRGQQSLGRFKPKANPQEYRSHWAAVEGDNDGRWGNVRDLSSVGLPIGSTGRSNLVFTEFRDENGKPNETVYNGVKLREMVVPIAEARDKERREALESTENCSDFLNKEDMRERTGENGLLTMRGELSTSEATGISHQADPEVQKRGPGRPPKS